MEEYCDATGTCACVAENRSTQCEYVERNNNVRCDKNGILRDTCNDLFEHKKVLCDEHEAISKPWYDKACRICGSSHRSCCC